MRRGARGPDPVILARLLPRSMLRLPLLLAAAALGTAAAAQAPLAVSVDCPGYVPACDVDFFQTETPWVRFVRDLADADVQVLIAAQQTGGGGRLYELRFRGRRGTLAGRADTLSVATEPAATEDAQRRAVRGRLALGLAGFAARTPTADALAIAYTAPEGGTADAAPTRDPWNGWVLRARANGFFDGQQRARSGNLSGSFSASLVTAASKYTARVFANGNREHFEFSDGETLTVSNHSFGGFGVAVWSLSPRVAAGIYGVAERSTFENYDGRVEVAPGVEANLYPYAEATRRQLRVQYEAGVWAAAYADTTLFGRTSEVRPFHELEVKAIFAQPWGSVDVGAEVNQFPLSPRLYRAQLSGNLSFRLARGLEMEVGGSAALVRNQINLVRGDASDEDVLTQQRELATGYRYFAFVGMSYTFGSVFNPVVNVRFD